MTLRLVGASLPRSGHHHLERLLGAALGPQLRYCEFYVPPGCCRSVPCTRRDAPVTLQKHHDFDGTLAKDLPGCHYVVQHREPVGGALSDRELHLRKHNPALVDDAADHEHWLAHRAVQHVAFVRRWVYYPPAAATVVDYADLLADPAAVVERVLVDIGWPHDPAAVRRAVATHAADTAHDDHHVGDSLDRPGFHPVLLPRFESLVRDELGLDGPRRLAPASWADTPMGVIYETTVALGATEVDIDAVLARIDAALAGDPGHAGLLWQRGLATQWAGGPDVEWFERANATSPDNPRLLLELANARHRAGDLVGWAEALEAVASLRPWVPEHHVHLAAARAALGDGPAATAAVEAAVGTDDGLDRWTPFPPELWQALVGIAEGLGAAPLAAEARRRAHARWPEHAAEI